MCYQCKTEQEREECSVNDRIEELYSMLEDAGLSVEAAPSNVSGSPHDYLYVWLSADRLDGPHVLVSDAMEDSGLSELDEPGIWIGRYDSVEHFEQGGETEEVAGVPEAAVRVLALASEGVPA